MRENLNLEQLRQHLNEQFTMQQDGEQPIAAELVDAAEIVMGRRPSDKWKKKKAQENKRTSFSFVMCVPVWASIH